jgi:hypothetical protein
MRSRKIRTPQSAPVGLGEFSPHCRGQRIGKGHEFTRVTSALLVWVGHSCPTPLTLILTLILRSAHGPCNTVEEQTLQRRVKRSNEEPGFSR